MGKRRDSSRLAVVGLFPCTTLKTTPALWRHILVTAAQRTGTRTATTVYRRVIFNRFAKGLALAPAR